MTIWTVSISIFALISLAVIFSLKTKGFFRLAVNSLASATTLALLSVFGVSFIPFNALSTIIVSLTGASGLFAVAVITLFL